MTTNRLEAFSDGVLAIIITIMVLELHAPANGSVDALRETLPSFFIYILSFATTGVFWNNHHHAIAAAKRVTARIMWANLNLLFWISLIPFATAWVGQHHASAWPASLYGLLLVLSGFSFHILHQAILADTEKALPGARTADKDWKGQVSLVLYAVGAVLAFWTPLASYALYALVILAWTLPDRKAEAGHEKQNNVTLQ